MNNPVVGKSGENIVLNYLKKNSYKIIDKNYKNKIGEIDIIAFDKTNEELVFIEVKSRTSLEFGLPSEAVDFRKQNKIRITASLFLIKNKKYEDKIRFDVIEILNNEITNHIKYAF